MPLGQRLGAKVREQIERRTEITRTHLRDESSVVPRDDLELDPALHLPVKFAHLRDIPQSDIVNGCPEQCRVRLQR